MIKAIGQHAKKSLDSSPDETQTLEKGKIDLVNLGNIVIGRGILEPGWSWEKCLKPIVKTNSCQAPHTEYFISGNGRWNRRRIWLVRRDGIRKTTSIAIPIYIQLHKQI